MKRNIAAGKKNFASRQNMSYNAACMKFVEFPDLIRRYYSGEQFVVFDTETTGLNTHHDEILEIAAATWQFGKAPSFFCELLRVNPNIIQPGAWAVHQIPHAELIAARQPQIVFKDFIDFCKNNTLIAHNARFDFEMLNSNLIRHGLKPYFQDQVVCTLRYAQQQLLPGKLGDLAASCKITVKPTHLHRALYDVELLMGIVNSMMKKYEPEEMQYSLIL